MNKPLLSVKNLQVGFRQGVDHVPAVAGIDFEIGRSETFALVGESGSGKSVTALSVLRLLPQGGRIVAGSARLDGVDLFRLREVDLAAVRGRRIGIVFQDPMSSLNPVMTIGRQLGEALRLHRGLRGVALQRRAVELLEQVGLPRPEGHLKDYPHQLSGGMRQRVMIAIALAGEPDLLIADEPTTALDVTIQAQILELLKRLQRERGMALWLITHDLGIVAEMADRVAVMRRGEIVETGASAPFFAEPKHPYSRQLFDAMPRLDSCRGRPKVPPDEPALLELRDFRVYYPIRKGLLQRTVDYVRAVDGVSLTLPRGRTLALVGESGCGKTTLGKAVLNLIVHSGGQVLFDDIDITGSEGEIRRLRCAEMQIVFQDPYAAMNPRMVVGDIVEEGLLALRPEMSVDERRARVDELLRAVGLPVEARLRYPHEFSGGQRQRICIARALAVNPRLIVCDEPTSALDVSVQRQIIGLLKDLRERRGLSYLFISHDLAVVAELADRIAVMYQGRIVELGEAEQVLFEPQHPYTRKLLQAAPRLHRVGFGSGSAMAR
jgi:ABC-type microcin C transport system duplicated ATPase subunit YejF